MTLRAEIVMHRVIMQKRLRRFYELARRDIASASGGFNAAILRKCHHIKLPNHARVSACHNKTGFDAAGDLVIARWRVARRAEFIAQTANDAARIKKPRVMIVSINDRQALSSDINKAWQWLAALYVKYDGNIQASVMRSKRAGVIAKI